MGETPFRSLLRRSGAEFIGTYGLVTAGCGAIMVNAQTGVLTHVGIALTFGLIITVMIRRPVISPARISTRRSRLLLR